MTMTDPVVEVPRIPFARAEISPEAREAVARVLSSGWVTTGPEVAAFEQDFARFVGAEHAVAVSSCTASIELSLRAMALAPGAKVLASTMTFCGAVNAIVHAGLEPVLVDVDPLTLMPDAETTAEAVARVGSVDAMTIVHYAGHPAPVADLTVAAGLGPERVVEDAAHALGTAVGEHEVGTISAATCFSFYATKNLPIGEGGMVTTGDEELAEFVRRCRLHGMSRDAWKRYLPGSGWRYAVEDIGLKANMTDIQAAIGRAQLPYFPSWQDRRAALVARYDEMLGALPGVVLPARPLEGRHAWHIYVIRVTDDFSVERDILMAELAGRGIDCSVHFIPLHQMPHLAHTFAEVDPAASFPRAESVFPQIVSLPLYPGLTIDQVDRVCYEIARISDEGSSLVPPDGGGSS